MKKFGFIISALALVLGLSQCRKPDTSIWHNNGLQTQTIEFTTSYNGGAKGDFQEVGNVLKYKWDIDNTDGKTDKLYVYAQTSEGTEFSSGSFVGSLPIVNVSEDGYTANFAGKISVPSGGIRYLRFVHYGQDINVGENGAASADFSKQDGTLPSISKKVVAVFDTPYNEDHAYTGRLQVQFAVAKLKFKKFEKRHVVISDIDYGKLNTVLSVTSSGTIEYKQDNSSSKLAIGRTENDEYNGKLELLKVVDVSPEEQSCSYAVFMPTENAVQYEFSNHYKIANLTTGWTLAKDKYYTADGECNPISITGKTQPYLRGGFTVKKTTPASDEDTVYFATGNLWYDDGTWKIEDKQYDYHTYNYTNTSYSTLKSGYAVENGVTTKPSYNPEGTIGFFRWGNENDAISPDCNSQCTSDFFAPANGSSFKVMVKGRNITWRTLSKDEIRYMLGLEIKALEYPVLGINARNEYELKHDTARMTTNSGYKIYGLVILPDTSDYYKAKSDPLVELGPKYISTQELLDKSGAVFLPAEVAGRNKNGVYYIWPENKRSGSNYWLGNKADANNVNYLIISSRDHYPDVSGGVYKHVHGADNNNTAGGTTGMFVRLVIEDEE